MGGQTRALRRDRLQAPEESKDWSWPRTQYDRGEDVLATILSECLDEMQRDGGDIETVLAQNPELTAEIKPLLEVAAMLRARRT
jgi:hypothetical protein